MAQTKIRGTTQILDGSVPLTKLVAGYSIPTSNLADGLLFLKSDGSVAMTSDLSLGGHKFTNSGDPVNPQDLVNLRTVQTLVNGVAIRTVRFIFEANITLSGVQNADEVTGVSSDEVLLIAQTNAAQNGPWVMNSGSWTRPTWWAAASTQKATLILVQEGTTYHDTKFICITDGSIVVDTTNTTWLLDQSGSTYTNGNGLSLVGSTFAVKLGDGTEFDGSQNVRVKLDGASLSRSASGVKISDGTAGYILQANASGQATWNAVSGDATISSTGVISVSVDTTTGFLKYANSIYNEVPVGTIDGTNTAFSIANTPVTNSLRLYFNGQRLKEGVGNDYTLSDTSITTLFAPISGDVLLADYLKADGSVST